MLYFLPLSYFPFLLFSIPRFCNIPPFFTPTSFPYFTLLISLILPLFFLPFSFLSFVTSFTICPLHFYPFVIAMATSSFHPLLCVLYSQPHIHQPWHNRRDALCGLATTHRASQRLLSSSALYQVVDTTLPHKDLLYFLVGDSPASEFYVPEFRNILFDVWSWKGVPKHLHINSQVRHAHCFF